MQKKPEIKLVAHPQYGFLQIKPTPSAEEITLFYNNEFYSGEYKNFNDSLLEVHLENRGFYEGIWSDMAFHIEKLFNRPLVDISMLDVGCGWAQCLQFFAAKGLKCYGFDPAPEAVAYGLEKGLNLRHAGMEKMDVFDGLRFDIVMLNNVLEHLADPVAVVTEIREKVLNRGGLIIIDVPNEFNSFQLAARDLHGLDNWWVAPPAHLNYFSKDTLCSLLEGCGYQIRLAESSFPLEIFMLFGDCYVGNNQIGKQCHLKRVAFEENLRRLGYEEKLRDFYQALASINLGRQIKIYASI
jgi:2-polyprenyl-3-methyl-5-hydroxy-6-metoxy-1,4-benzoquinol methylase